MPRGTPEGGAINAIPKSATLGIAVPWWVPPAGARAGGAQAAPLQGQQQLGRGPCVQGHRGAYRVSNPPHALVPSNARFHLTKWDPSESFGARSSSVCIAPWSAREKAFLLVPVSGFWEGCSPRTFSDRLLLWPAPLPSSYFKFMCGGERILLKQQNPQETSASISKLTQRTGKAVFIWRKWVLIQRKATAK